MSGHGVACCQPVRGQDAIVQAGIRWAERDERVRALLLKGSLARGDGDQYSDVDFVVIAQPGQIEALWADRVTIAESLGGWLGGFDEVAWQARHTFIGFCDGPVKVDFFFQEGEPRVDPWLRDGFRALVDEHGLADRLRAKLQAPLEPPDLADFDAHAWDWLWACRLKLRRPGHEWLVYLELVKFVETMLLAGFGALAPEPWRGVLRMEERLPPEARAELRRALPDAPEDAELRRALTATIASYVALRPRLAAECGMPLADELAAQVLPVLTEA
jgi:predicted nucleotidyltransferase